MNIKQIKVSRFNNARDTRVLDDSIEIGDALESIKNGTYKELVDKVRAGNSEVKKKLPMVAMHGLFDGFRKKDLFIEASGLIVLDFDDIDKDDLTDIKDEIMDQFLSVLAVMTSPSGNGLKVLYFIEPDIVTADNYRQIGKQVAEKFSQYGQIDVLSITDCLIMTYDPDIRINENVFPEEIWLNESYEVVSELEPLDESRELWDDPEDFFETVFLNDILNKTDNNYHFIQVSILDLAKFGFYHPEHDLSFVINYAEEHFKKSVDNKQRFLEVTELAHTYPKIKHPYRIIPNWVDGDEEDGYVDYNEYLTQEEREKEPIKKEKEYVYSEGIEEGEEENDGFIDYETIFDKVLLKVKEGDRVGAEISLENFADIFRFKGTGILTVTGIPGHGKTEFLDACAIDLARLHNEDTIVVGFEQEPEEHIMKLSKKLIGSNVSCPTWNGKEENLDKLEDAVDFIKDHFQHVDIKKTGGNINTLLKVCAKRIQVMRKDGKNPKYIILDPFNMLSISGRLSGHEKIEEILRRISHFSLQMGVLAIIVAHPFKMKKNEKTGIYEVPDFYSVKGTSAFFEMSYHGFVIYRANFDTQCFVKILKVKQNNMGVAGAKAYFDYMRDSGRYIPVDESGNWLKGDHQEKDWIEKAKELTNKK